MKRNKRLLSLLLAVVMIVGMFPLSASAEDEIQTPCEVCSSTEHTTENHVPVVCEVCKGEDGRHTTACPTNCTCETKPAEGEAHAVGCPLNLTPVTTSLDDETTSGTTVATTTSGTTDGTTTSGSTDGTTAATTTPDTTGGTTAATTETTQATTAPTTEATTEATTVPATEATTEATTEPAKTFAETLMEIDNLSDLLIEVCKEENLDALLALTTEEITVLQKRTEELYGLIENPAEQDEWDRDDLLATLEMLPNYLAENACPDCGQIGEHTEDCPWLHMAVMPADGQVGATTISSNTTWNLTRDVTLTGTVRIKSGATLRIYNHVNNTATRTIKRGSGFTGDMFYVEAGGTLHINGYDWNNGNWNSGPIVIDGNAGVTATGQIIDCNGKLSLRDAVIRNNKGVTGIWIGGTGAGTPVDQYHYTTVEITRVLIENCSATSGGGIFIAGSTPADYSVEIWNSKINNCTAIDASAIYFANEGQAKVYMRTSVVENCDTTTGGDGQYGGALRTNGNGRYKFTMEDCVVRNCDSWKFGGGIYWNAAGTGSQLIVTDCQFLNNTAAEMGGGMFLEGSNMTINASAGTPTAAITSGMPGQIIGTLIQDNHAPNGGGISYKCYSNDISVQIPKTVANFNENVIFKDNTGTNGAALAYNMHNTHNYPTGATFTFNINGAQFTNNISTGTGGAIYVVKCRDDYVCAVNFNSGTITNNKANNGGAIAITTYTGVTVGGTFNMYGGNLSDNSATANGGAVYLQNGTFNMMGGTVADNEAVNGGAAYITGGSFEMSNGTVTSNEAASGGAVYVNDGDFTISNGSITSNTASGNGGAAYVNGGDFIMNHGIIGGNTADEANDAVNGGAIYVTDGNFEMSNGSITGNIASTNGGAAYVAGGNITIYHGAIDSNSAKQGGAVYMAGDANTTLTMESGTMNSNTASDDGGAIYATSGTIKIGLEACKAETAAELASCSHHTAKGTGRHHPEINGNSAADTGGGIAIANDGVVHFYCGEANENEALYKGVGMNVFMDGGDFHLYDGANIGIPRDPDLVIIGGELHNECVNKDYIKLYYYQHNTDTQTSMEGLAEYQETMNLPDGTYYWTAPQGYTFLGWTAKGATSGTLSDEYVRNKEQYLDSGAPIEILDHTSAESDQTGINTNRAFDGTNDKVIHLYALWAPLESTITYVDGVTYEIISHNASDPDNPENYSFNRNSNIIDINPVAKPGYDLVGWYIYQNEGQNANWNETLTDESFEPVYIADATEKSYSNLDFIKENEDDPAVKYIALDTRNSVLMLEAGDTNFGDITLIADYKPAFTTLIIDKAYPDGVDYSMDAGQTFIFNISGKPSDGELEDINMNVVISGDGIVTIEELPVGEYTVKEISGWSWRYGTTTVQVGSADAVEGTIAEVTASDAEVDYKVTFTNTRTKTQWLDGDSFCRNWFNGLSFVND